MFEFRASPWVHYSSENMDAPAISTLPQERTPPPPARSSTSKFRVKLRVADDEPPKPAPRPAAEEEEDQLIDDDEAAVMPSAPGGSAAPAKGKKPSASPGKPRKRKDPAKTYLPKTDSGASSMMSAWQVEPPPPPTTEVWEPTPTPAPAPTVAPPAKPPVKRKPPVKKGTPTAPRAPRKSAANKIAQLQDDAGSNSEAFPGTASSSPYPFHEANTPEYLPPPPDDFVLDPTGTPLAAPVHPLPTRPFPVQAAPRVPVGYAANPPLDKNGPPPRHWKVAHREIRNISGSRWFARTWVGDAEKPLPIPNVVPAIIPPILPVSIPSQIAITLPSTLPPVPTTSKSSVATSNVRNPTKLKFLKPETGGPPITHGETSQDVEMKFVG